MCAKLFLIALYQIFKNDACDSNKSRVIFSWKIFSTILWRKPLRKNFRSKIFINKLLNLMIIYLYPKIRNGQVVENLFPEKMTRDIRLESHYFWKFGIRLLGKKLQAKIKFVKYIIFLFQIFLSKIIFSILNDPFNNIAIFKLDSWVRNFCHCKRPGLQSRHSRKLLFFHRKISNSFNLNITIFESKIIYLCLRPNFCSRTTLIHLNFCVQLEVNSNEF